MKRTLMVAAIVTLLSAPGTAFAAQADQAGCQAFGQAAAAEAQGEGGLGEVVREFVPVNDDVVVLKQDLCG